MLIAGEWVLKNAQQRGRAEIIKLGRQQRTRNGVTDAREHLVIEIAAAATTTTSTTTPTSTTETSDFRLQIEKRPIKACNRSRGSSIDKFPLLPRTRSIGEEFTIRSRSLPPAMSLIDGFSVAVGGQCAYAQALRRASRSQDSLWDLDSAYKGEQGAKRVAS